jgi:hypothetical protein
MNKNNQTINQTLTSETCVCLTAYQMCEGVGLKILRCQGSEWSQGFYVYVKGVLVSLWAVEGSYLSPPLSLIEETIFLVAQESA